MIGIFDLTFTPFLVLKYFLSSSLVYPLCPFLIPLRIIAGYDTTCLSFLTNWLAEYAMPSMELTPVFLFTFQFFLASTC